MPQWLKDEWIVILFGVLMIGGFLLVGLRNGW